jgi:hypothetical protein
MDSEIKIKVQKPNRVPPVDLQTRSKKQRTHAVFFIRATFLIILLGLLILGIFYLFNYFKAKNIEDTTSPEVEDLVSKVGDLIYIPKDEIPTIATVSNIELLKGQTFFAEAKQGDKVLIYKNAQKAILYDPVADKIVTVAPLVVGDQNNKNTTEAQKESAMFQY